MKHEELIKELLADPKELTRKKPFFRGSERGRVSWDEKVASMNELVSAYIPSVKKRIVTQEEFDRELDPNAHTVLFDDNIPSICVKVRDGGYHELKFEKVALPFQKIIKSKQVMHLSANPMQFTLVGTNPTQATQDDFILFKEYWTERNQDGMKTKMVDTQLSCGDAGLLYYFDYKGRIKSRLLSYSQGHCLCSHDDQNGDRVLETVYYSSEVKTDEGITAVEFIDSYDDKYMYRYTSRPYNNAVLLENGWYWHEPVEHGFDEIPLITKRGDVAWNAVQTAIECYEMLYNIALVVFKRFGYGIFYVKGKFKDKAQKIAGAIVLEDSSMDGNGDAKFLAPPAPTNVMETLDLMLQNIQLGSSTTFLLPKDIKTGGDIAGITIQLVQSLDLELANQKVIEWQNVADKMVRLFKYGLAKELVNSGERPTAVTDFAKMKIIGKFKIWKPLNDYEYNQMVSMLKGAGILSEETSIELNTLSKPDEKARIKRERDAAEKKIEEQQQKLAESSVQKNKEGEQDGLG